MSDHGLYKGGADLLQWGLPSAERLVPDLEERILFDWICRQV